MTPRRIVPSTIPYCLRFPDSLMVLRRSSAHRRYPPFSPLALPFPLILSLRSFWRRDGGRTDVACRAVPNEDQRSTRAAGTSECPPTSSRTHPTLRRSRLPSVARCCESRYGIPYAYAGGNTRQAVPWRMRLSIHPSIARRWIRLVILRLSEKARSLSQSRRRRGGGEAKRKLKTTVRQSDQPADLGKRETELHSARNCGARLRVSLDNIATVFLSVSRELSPKIRRRTENVRSDYWGFYYRALLRGILSGRITLFSGISSEEARNFS